MVNLLIAEYYAYIDACLLSKKHRVSEALIIGLKP